MISEFDAKLKAMEDKFMAQYDAQNAIIAQFEKDHAENAITRDVEDLIRDGHVSPANRELCSTILFSMKSADKVEFSIADEVIEDPCTLFKHLLSSYSAWEADKKDESSDNIAKDVATADPIEEPVTNKMYSGKAFKVDNAKTADLAKALQAKYAAEGKKVDYMICFKEVKGIK